MGKRKGRGRRFTWRRCCSGRKGRCSTAASLSTVTISNGSPPTSSTAPGLSALCPLCFVLLKLPQASGELQRGGLDGEDGSFHLRRALMAVSCWKGAGGILSSRETFACSGEASGRLLPSKSATIACQTSRGVAADPQRTESLFRPLSLAKRCFSPRLLNCYPNLLMVLVLSKVLICAIGSNDEELLRPTMRSPQSRSCSRQGTRAPPRAAAWACPKPRISRRLRGQ